MTADQTWFSDDATNPGKKKRAPHVRPVTAGERLDHRPVIRVEKGEIPRMVDQAIAALSASPGDVYTREGDLVHVAAAPPPTDDAPSIPEGSPRIYTLSSAGLTEHLSRVAAWSKASAPADPPPPVVGAFLARRRWPGLRPLSAIVDAPTLRPDGSLLTEPGYDASTRTLYAPSERWPAPNPEPTADDALQALTRLWNVFCDFPWETDAGSYVAIAALLTLVARPAIEGCIPCFVFDANSPASGKTLVSDVIATIALGRDAGRHSYPTDPKGSNEEVSKALAGYALAGARLICWDNLSPANVFGGPALESVSTARDKASFRILGKNENAELPWRTVMLATGNNVAISRDLERRSLIPRFVSKWETADARPLDSFRHPERAGRLIGWARGERHQLVLDALTVLRAYHVAGRPPQGLRWASFEEWTALVPSAIQWAGGHSPLACRPADTGRGSEERGALAIVLRDWSRVDSTGEGVTVASVLATLYPDTRPGEHRPPDGLDDLRDALETLAPPRDGRSPDKLKLTGAFRRVRQVVVGGRSLEAAEQKTRTGVVRWRVVGV